MTAGFANFFARSTFSQSEATESELRSCQNFQSEAKIKRRTAQIHKAMEREAILSLCVASLSLKATNRFEESDP